MSLELPLCQCQPIYELCSPVDTKMCRHQVSNTDNDTCDGRHIGISFRNILTSRIEQWRIIQQCHELQSPSLQLGKSATVVAVGIKATVEVVVIELYALQILEHGDEALVHGASQHLAVICLGECTAIEVGCMLPAQRSTRIAR